MTATRNKGRGYIEPGVLYTASEARSRLGLGDWAWRKLRRDGLHVIRHGGRAYVWGADLISLIRRQSSKRPGGH